MCVMALISIFYCSISRVHVPSRPPSAPLTPGPAMSLSTSISSVSSVTIMSCLFDQWLFLHAFHSNLRIPPLLQESINVLLSKPFTPMSSILLGFDVSIHRLCMRDEADSFVSGGNGTERCAIRTKESSRGVERSGNQTLGVGRCWLISWCRSTPLVLLVLMISTVPRTSISMLFSRTMTVVSAYMSFSITNGTMPTPVTTPISVSLVRSVSVGSVTTLSLTRAVYPVMSLCFPLSPLSLLFLSSLRLTRFLLLVNPINT